MRKLLGYRCIGLIVFLVVIITVIINSYFHHDGYLTPDSTEYLTLVANSDITFNLEVKNNVPVGAENKLFATWPIGYPYSIWIFSKITGQTPFISSKILNVCICGFFILIFLNRFKSASIYYFPLLLMGTSLLLFSASLSESLFTLLFFILVIFVEKFSVRNLQKVISSTIILTLLILCIPLIRYAGVFVFFYITLILIIKLRDRKFRTSIVLFVSLLFSSLIYLSYLIHNLVSSGAITGSTRPSGFFFKPILILKSLIGELVVIYPGFSYKALIIQFLVLVILRLVYRGKFRLQNTLISEADSDKTKVFLIPGVLYLIFILITGIITNFQDYNSRFLFPGTFLLFIYLIGKLKKRYRKLHLLPMIYGLVVLSISYNMYNLYKSKLRRPLNYIETTELVFCESRSIEMNSIVLDPPKHLNYLRPDLLLFTRGYYKNFDFEKSKLEELYPDKVVYVYSDSGKYVRLSK